MQVMEMVRGTTEAKLMEDTERNLHEFAVNVRPALLQPLIYPPLPPPPREGVGRNAAVVS